jgi:hypothetical protein
MSTQMQPEASVSRAVQGSKCVREIRRNQVGQAVYCDRPASLNVDKKPLCVQHAEEAMLSRAARPATNL